MFKELNITNATNEVPQEHDQEHDQEYTNIS
jgi:hypothetical protein